jgi:hypothetical protein
MYLMHCMKRLFVDGARCVRALDGPLTMTFQRRNEPIPDFYGVTSLNILFGRSPIAAPYTFLAFFQFSQPN